MKKNRPKVSSLVQFYEGSLEISSGSSYDSLSMSETFSELDENLTDHDLEVRSRRRDAVFEVLASEQSYINSLKELKDTFVEPMKKEKLFTELIPPMFSNLHTIFMLNSEFLEALGERMVNFGHTTKIGGIVARFSPFFQMYTTYCNNYNSALEKFLKTCESNAKFRTFINKAEASSSIRFTDFLILPVQRIPRYVILIEAVLKYTDITHPDRRDLEHALDQVRSVANAINSKMEEAENREKVIDLQNKFDCSLTLELVVAHRRYLDETVAKWHDYPEDSYDDESGYVIQQPGEVRLILLSDILLVVQDIVHEGKTLYTLEVAFELSTTFIMTPEKLGENYIHILNPRSSFYYFYFDTPEEKTAWVQLANDAIKDLIYNNETSLDERKKIIIAQECGQLHAVSTKRFCDSVDKHSFFEDTISFTTQELKDLRKYNKAVLRKSEELSSKTTRTKEMYKHMKKKNKHYKTTQLQAMNSFIDKDSKMFMCDNGDYLSFLDGHLAALKAQLNELRYSPRSPRNKTMRRRSTKSRKSSKKKLAVRAIQTPQARSKRRSSKRSNTPKRKRGALEEITRNGQEKVRTRLFSDGYKSHNSRNSFDESPSKKKRRISVMSPLKKISSSDSSKRKSTGILGDLSPKRVNISKRKTVGSSRKQMFIR
eukprot:TRINITY_DN7491_c0_g1_i1.p1 TRINITY_DN7491_c0_g1~~TRINITY_DN7491_c0_g1_i1.p1  ORF type:complete len:656 (+),score=125.47 TRINITY_DN7491_c0_g1_i1:43-2010(+)